MNERKRKQEELQEILDIVKPYKYRVKLSDDQTRVIPLDREMIMTDENKARNGNQVRTLADKLEIDDLHIDFIDVEDHGRVDTG